MIEFILGIWTPLSTISMPASMSTSSNTSGNLPSRSRIKNRARLPASWKSMTRFLAAWVTQVLAATLFLHIAAGFGVHVPAGLGGDVLGLGWPGEAGEQACWRGGARVRPAWALRGSGSGRADARRYGVALSRLASASIASRSSGVVAGLLVGGAAGAEFGDRPAVLGLGSELADPGGQGGAHQGWLPAPSGPSWPGGAGRQG